VSENAKPRHALLSDFYAGDCGKLAAKLIGEQIAALWPDLKGMRVLAVGWPFPYLEYLQSAAHVLVATPHFTAAETALLQEKYGAAAIVSLTEDHLPFYTRSFDRILSIHGCEYSANFTDFFGKAEKLLKNDGRIIAAIPNSCGLWCGKSAAPFSGGRRVTEARITAVLENSGFAQEYHGQALAFPPLQNKKLLRWAEKWEKTGRFLMPFFCGVHICEARKHILSGAALKPEKRAATAPAGLAGAGAK